MLEPFFQALTIEEVLWFLIALVSFILSLQNLGEALRDLQSAAREPEPTPGLFELAMSAVRSESLRIVTTFCFLVAGLIAMTSNPDAVSRQGIVITLLLGNFALMLQAFIDRTDNHRLRQQRVLEQEQRHEIRDIGRDAGRDPVRDFARDEARDAVHDSLYDEPPTIPIEKPPTKS